MIVAITGASAGVGRATAREFAARGWDVAVIARNAARLDAAAEEVRRLGVRSLPVVADVADFPAVEAAAAKFESELGPIDAWINNAMATVFAPVKEVTATEFRRGTEVTYLGQVHGTMAALKHMAARNSGTIVNIGSALAYRPIPLQSVYCGAKSAVRGFTDALRSELMHDGSAVHVVMVQLPALNTPQFDWALNKTGRKPRPVPPVYQPELAARGIFFATTHPGRREVWVGVSTWQAILANRLVPGLLDRYLAKAGYDGQMTDAPADADAPANLFTSPDTDVAAHGRFDSEARDRTLIAPVSRHPGLTLALLAGIAGFGIASLLNGHGREPGQQASRWRNARTLHADGDVP